MGTSATRYATAAVAVTGPMDTDLDGLLNDEWTSESDEVDNSVTGYPMMDLELQLASAAFTGADSAVEVYVIPLIDASTYPDWGGADATADRQENQVYYRGAFRTSGTTAAQRLTLERIHMPPGKFKFGIRSRANVTLGTGNTLSYRPYQHSYTA